MTLLKSNIQISGNADLIAANCARIQQSEAAISLITSDTECLDRARKKPTMLFNLFKTRLILVGNLIKI